MTVSLGARDDGLKAALAGAERNVATFAKSFAGLAVAAGGIAAVKGAFDAFKGFADYAGGIADLAAQTGLTSEATMVWSQALKNAGLEAGALGPLMNRLQKAMTGVNEEGEPTNKAFERLGINIGTFRALKPEQQLDTIAAAISSLPDPADRAAAAMELFGKSGGKALALFTDSGALSTAREQLGDLATNLGTSIASLDKLSDAINAAGENKGMQFMAGFAKGFAGDIDEAANSINRIDLSEAGTWAGEIAKKLKEASDYARIIMNTPIPKVGEMIGFLSPESQAAMAAMDEAFLKAQAEKIAAGQDALAGPAEAIKKADDAMQSLAETASNLKLEGLGPIVELQERGVDLLSNQSVQLEHNLDLYDAQKTLAETLLQTDEQRAKAAEAGAAAEAKRLEDLKAQSSERMNAAKNQLSTIAGADVPAVGERGSRARAARKALELEGKAAQAEAFGDTERAKGFREKAAKARGKAFGKEGDKVGTEQKVLEDIRKEMQELNRKLPTPALAP